MSEPHGEHCWVCKGDGWVLQPTGEQEACPACRGGGWGGD